MNLSGAHNSVEIGDLSSKIRHYKCSGLVPWEDPEGWDEEGGWRWDQDGEYM